MNSLPLLLLALVAALSGCTSVEKFLKADGHEPTPQFAMTTSELKADSGETPFHLAYHNSDREVLERASKARFLYVAPVRIDRLGDIDPSLARAEADLFDYKRPVREIATNLRMDIYQAFLESPAPRYEVHGMPQPDGVTLRLALVELNPTAPVINMLKFPLRLVSPLLPFAAGATSKGSVAIEGVLTENRTGAVVFAFADREKDPFSLFSFRDYAPWGHTPVFLEDWAEQFEEFTRTPPEDEVDDTLPIRINPF